MELSEKVIEMYFFLIVLLNEDNVNTLIVIYVFLENMLTVVNVFLVI